MEIGVREAKSAERAWFMSRGWRNIVVDVLPSTINDVRALTDQRVYSLNSCVSLRRPRIRRFTEYSYYTPRFDFSLKSILRHFRPHTYTYTPCFTLNTIFSAFGVRKIDFLSLDVYGGELKLLESIDFARTLITFVRVRQSAYEKRRDLVIQSLVKRGYRFKRQINSDLFFAKIF